MKRFAGTLVTISLLGALAGYYFWVDVPREQQELKETQESARVLPYLLDQVQDFTYTHQDFTMHAVKDGIVWKLKEPVEALADHMAINGMLQELEGTRHLRVVEENAEDPAVFGLKDPEVRITLKEKTFGEKTVLIGDESPLGHSAYWKTADNPRVLLVPGLRKNWIKTLYQFRDKTVLRLNPQDITSLTLTRPQNVLKMEKKAEGWMLSSPIEARGDDNAIADLISKMKYAQVQEFVEESPEKLEPYGLSAPERTALFSDGKDTWELLLGKEKDTGLAHAKLKTAANVVAVEAKLKEMVETSHLDLIDKRVLTFKEDEITAIEIADATGKLRLVKSDGENAEWKMEGQDKTEVDQAVVSSLLFDLKDVRALGFVSFGKADSFGLDHPEKTLTLTNGKGEQQSLKLGNRNLDGRQVFLSRSLDDGIFVLETEKAEKFFRPVDDFKNRRLIRIEESKAQRIVLEYPGKSFELIRNDDGWDLLRPEKIEGLKPYIGNDILWTLNNLKAEKEIVSPTAEEKEMKTPALTVSVFDSADNPQVELKVGPSAREEKKLRALIFGHPAPVLVADRLLGEIPHETEKFRSSKK